MTWSIRGLQSPVSQSATEYVVTSNEFGAGVVSQVKFTGTGFTYDAATGLLKTGTITKAELVVNGSVVQRVDVSGGIAAATYFNFFSSARTIATEVQGWGVTANDAADYDASGTLISMYTAGGNIVRIVGSGFSAGTNNGTVTSVTLYTADGVTVLDTVGSGLPMPLGYVAAGFGGEYGYYHYLVQGNNTITHLSSDWLIALEGGTGTDALINQTDQPTTAAYVQATGAVTVDLSSGTASGNQGSDTLTNVVNVIGGNFDDSLTGNAFNNSIDGGLGNDTLNGGAGFDRLRGGAGNDSMSGGTESDTLNGGLGNDTYNGGDGIDTADFEDYDGSTSGVVISLAVAGPQATGGQGTDTLISIENVIGSIYGDQITGDANGNRIEGLAGNDTIFGGAGVDVILGGVGADQLYGGADTDYLYIDRFDTVIDGGTGYDGVFIQDGANFTFDVGAANVEWVYGWTGNNVLNAATAAQGVALIGEAGADQLIGSAFNDYIYFDAFDTVVDAGAGYDALFVYQGSGQGAIDTTVNVAAANAEWVLGGNGNDTIFNTGRNVSVALSGGAGNDTITGGLASDYLYGNAGNDVFVVTANSQFDAILDMANGADRIDVRALGAAFDTFAEIQAVATSSGGSTTINFGGGNRLFLYNFALGNLDAGDFIF